MAGDAVNTVTVVEWTAADLARAKADRERRLDELRAGTPAFQRYMERTRANGEYDVYHDLLKVDAATCEDEDDLVEQLRWLENDPQGWIDMVHAGGWRVSY